jgi:phosphoserine phosphatase
VLNRREGVFGADEEQIATTLAAQCAVVLQRSMLLEEYIVKQKLERDLAIAREIQMGVLPEELPSLPGYELAGWSRPADETGGDVYDAASLNDHRVALLLGDATGHGIGPALSVSQVRAMFHMGLLLGADLDQVFSKINEQLTLDLPSERFVTGFIGILDNEDHRLRYHSGGQGPLLHYHSDGKELEWVNASALPMGMFATLPLVEPAPIELSPGDIFALITDGFFEYEDPAGEEYGKDRLGQTVLEHAHLPPADLIKAICASVKEFAKGAPQQDDMTIVLIKRGVRP